MESISRFVNQKAERPERVLQIGEGNFLRAFADFLIDIMNEKGIYDGSVVLCQPIERGLCEAINEQNGLYTVIERGTVNGQAVERPRVIKSISRCINPYDDFEAFLQLGRSRDLEVIISNTTEAGIAFRETDNFDDKPPQSYPAKLTKLLFERFTAFGGEGHGLLVLPVELIEHNGTRLKECIKDYISLWKLSGDFERWLDKECFFADTLVDRIVSGYPKDSAFEFCEKLGYEDKLLDTAEPFLFWAIQASKEKSSVFPADKSGYNVIFTDDITAYKTRKVRILNGSHTLSVLAAFMAGHDTVYQMMNDNIFERLIEKAQKEEIIPFIDLPESEKAEFASSVLERFRNPFLNHRLLDISLNSVSKYRARCLPSLLDYAQQHNTAPKNLCFALAALLAFYDGEWDNGAFFGSRNGEKYEIRDDREVLEFISNNTTEQILKNEDFWGMDLCAVPGLSDMVLKSYNDIKGNGVRAALERIL